MDYIYSSESYFKYSITHWFQPIYNLKNNSVIGFEALLRDPSQLHVSPVIIFKDAEKKGYQNILDFTSISNAINTFKNEYNTLFLNIYPSTLLEKNFLSWWDNYVPSVLPVVLELLENEPIENWGAYKPILKELSSRGVKIAIDDFGAGNSSIRHWIEMEPDFIKLDRYFSENLSVNLRKQKALRCLVELLSGSTKVVIEGLEKEEDLYMAELLGVQYGQGYLLGRPSPLSKKVLNYY